MNRCTYCARFVLTPGVTDPYRIVDLFTGGCRGMGADVNRQAESPCGGRLFMPSSEWVMTPDGRFQRREGKAK